MKQILCIILAVMLLHAAALPAQASEASTEPSGTTESSTESSTMDTEVSPTAARTETPTETPTGTPTEALTETPTEAPTEVPTEVPTEAPTEAPTEVPIEAPTETPEVPTEAPTEAPTGAARIPTELKIDSGFTYQGMDMRYEDGYIPRVSDGIMHLVLPLIPTGIILQNKIDVSLSLDAGSGSPFIVNNFRKTFYLESVYPLDAQTQREIFLVAIDIGLTEKRQNGTYPVTVNVSGFDEEGNSIDCSYTIYVTITDGKIEKAVQTYTEVATAEPVVYISKTVVEPQAVEAGAEFTMTLTLKNSLITKSVRNMLATVDTGNVQISLLDDSSVFPVDIIAPGGEAELILHLRTDQSIPSGKYPINVSFKYDSNKTLNLSSSGSAIVEINQKANMELVMPRVAKSISVGETVPLAFQVMNMGRSAMYNVRCVLSGYGFVPSQTGFIGTMEAGSSSTTKMDVYIIALNASEGNENGAQYGETTGTVTLLFEDEKGVEYTQSATFETEIKRPVVDISQASQNNQEEEQTASQWWVSVSVLGGVLIVGTVAGIFLRRRKKKGGAYL